MSTKIKVEEINKSGITLISVYDYYVDGKYIFIPSGYTKMNFNSFDELETFRDNNPHLGLDEDYIIPEIIVREAEEYKDATHIIYNSNELRNSVSDVEYIERLIKVNKIVDKFGSIDLETIKILIDKFGFSKEFTKNSQRISKKVW